MRRLLPLVALFLMLFSTGSGAIAQVDPLRQVTQQTVALEPLPPGARVELVLDHVRNPVAMAFAPDGRWFFTERTTGWVRVVSGSSHYPIFYVPARSEGERGSLGVAVDPNFASNGYVYVYYTSDEDRRTTGKLDNRIVRYTIQGNNASGRTFMLKAPLDSDSSVIHNGGNMRFGPDGKLYVSIGDYFNAGNGQNLSTLPAKIHRFNPTTPLSAPSDNPFYDGGGPQADSIYAFGLRNPFDFDFDPVTGALFAADNGVACDDEINRLLPGANSGWRVNYPACDDFSAGGPDPNYNTLPPLIAWPYSAVPTGVMFYRGNLFPEWKNDLFVCHWKNGELHHFKLNGARTAIAAHTILAGLACHIDVETGNGGAIYFIRNEDPDPNKEYRDIYRITRDATIYASTFAPSNVVPRAGEALTYTLRLVHYGTLTTTFSITSSLPPLTTLIAGSPQASGGAISGSGTGVAWSGSITPNTTLTAVYRVAVNANLGAPTPLGNTARISTSNAGALQLPTSVIANGRSIYLPLALRAFMP
ncbi:MAG TPA: PQQ-dependent sugar dehydrogenase [Anaerolineae bacterium]|nr:PQQ-dependent sugar dehydrogenase [Anaerolineae bacterium]